MGFVLYVRTEDVLRPGGLFLVFNNKFKEYIYPMTICPNNIVYRITSTKYFLFVGCYFNLNNTNPLANANFWVLEWFVCQFAFQCSHFVWQGNNPIEINKKWFFMFAVRTSHFAWQGNIAYADWHCEKTCLPAVITVTPWSLRTGFPTLKCHNFS